MKKISIKGRQMEVRNTSMLFLPEKREDEREDQT